MVCIIGHQQTTTIETRDSLLVYWHFQHRLNPIALSKRMGAETQRFVSSDFVLSWLSISGLGADDGLDF
jgi:hypothetical protein